MNQIVFGDVETHGELAPQMTRETELPTGTRQGTITYYPELIQGSDEWLAARCGLLTASEMKLIITPGTKKRADNDKARQHLYELLAQRVTRYVEPSYISNDMLRGQEDEIIARQLYDKEIAPVADMGFITNNKWGFTLGYSPDGMVADNGLIECKSRGQAHQMKTLVEHVARSTIPQDYILQIQTGLLVSEREWCDFLTFCGGLHMAVVRVHSDPGLQTAILDAAAEFERQLVEKMEAYRALLASGARIFETERRIVQEMFT